VEITCFDFTFVTHRHSQLSISVAFATLGPRVHKSHWHGTAREHTTTVGHLALSSSGGIVPMT
jgi:hypothetical protein